MDAFEKISQWRATILEVETGTQLDAEMLARRIAEKAADFRQLGVIEKSRVVISATSSISFFVDLAAIWRERALAIVVDSNLTTLEFSALLREVQPHFIVNDQGIHPCPVDLEFHAAIPTGSCLILYTSGSSARPKAVIHTADSLLARINSIHQAISPNFRTTSLNVLPLHFGHGLVGVCLSALCLDGVLAITPRISLHNGHLVGDWLERSQATFMSGTPAIWKLIVSLNERPKPRLQRVQCASAKTGASLFRMVAAWADAPIWNVYGLTECASWVSDHRFERDGDEQIVGDGLAWETHFSLGDEISQPGRPVLLQSAGLFSHYLTQTPEQSGLSAGQLMTGDLGERLSNGLIRLLGRSTRLINRGGIKISPEEVESAIMEHPEIEEAIVFAKARGGDTQDDEHPFVAAVLVGNSKLTPAELRNFLTERLSEYKIPTLWQFVAAIPKTPNGKADLAAIQELWRDAYRK